MIKRKLEQFEPIEYGTEAMVSHEEGDDRDDVYDETIAELEEHSLAGQIMRQKRGL